MGSLKSRFKSRAYSPTVGAIINKPKYLAFTPNSFEPPLTANPWSAISCLKVSSVVSEFGSIINGYKKNQLLFCINDCKSIIWKGVASELGLVFKIHKKEGL